MRKTSMFNIRVLWVTQAVLCLGLAACGGGGNGDDGSTSAFRSSSAAQVVSPAENPLTQWLPVAAEGQGFVLAQAGVVRFGADSSWVDKDVAAGAAECSAAFFGSNPAPTVSKVCLLASAPASPAP